MNKIDKESLACQNNLPPSKQTPKFCYDQNIGRVSFEQNSNMSVETRVDKTTSRDGDEKIALGASLCCAAECRIGYM
jgi:hypothetical protein